MSTHGSRRRFLAQTAGIGSSLLLPARAFAADVRMRCVWWGGQDRAKRTNEAIQIFEKQRSDLKVATESTAWADYWTKVATLVAHAFDELALAAEEANAGLDLHHDGGRLRKRLDDCDAGCELKAPGREFRGRLSAP